MRTSCGTILAAAFALAAFGNDEKCPISENVRGHENIEWSISYAYGLTDATKDLPRVLLVGDSICNGYQNDVRDLLKGKVNVTYWVSSYCVTSPAYLPLLSVYLDEAKYDVIHFNNGLHSLSQTTIDAYSKGYRAALELIRRKQPQAKIVWCSSTPLYDIHYTGDRARYMKKVPELNAAVAKVVAEFGVDGTDDLFALCNPLDRKENWRDGCHFHPSAIAKQAEQVAASVLSALNSTHSEAFKAVQPFSPVEYKKTGETSFEIGVWGRTYRYENSVFPVSVKTAGREIFAAPMSLHAKFGDVEGEFRDWQYTLFSEGPDETVVVAAAHCSNVMVNASMTFERDGLVRTELKVVPYGYYSLHHIRDYAPDLSALWFDIDLKPESSTLFHYWPYSENSCVVTADVNSGETKTREHPFRAYTWCGWEDGGFSVTCESAEGFELDDAKKCISVTRTDGGTRVRYRLLDHAPAAWKGRRDRWGDAIIPLCWEFGLQATPVKSRSASDPDVYRRIHIYEVEKANVLESDIAERLGKAGVRYAVLHSTYSRAEGYGLIGNPAEFQAIVDKFHANGVKVLVYYGFEYPTILPGWSRKKDDYLIRHPGGKWVGGWQAETHRAYQSCYASGWADEVERNALEIVDRYGLDGIYTDGMCIPWECANERHGCGWRDANGDLHPTFPIYSVRRLVRRLYEGVHARGGVVEAHQSACMVTPLLAYVDSCFDGENVQDALAKNPEHLPTDAFRCEYSGYAFGLPMTFISYTNDKLTIQMLAAITLVHNVHPVPRELADLDFVSRVWKIYEDRGLDAAEFVPYWREKICDTPAVYASKYRDGKRTTIIVSNLSKTRRTATVAVPAGAQEAVDLLTGERFTVSDGKVEFPAEPFTPYVFAIE